MGVPYVAYRRTTKSKEGLLFKDVQDTYKNKPLGSANFPYLASLKELIYDGSPEAIVVATSFEYDAYGNLKAKTVTDPVTGNRRTEGAFYYYDAGDWILSLPKTTYIEDPASPTASVGTPDADCNGGARAQQTCYKYESGTNLLRRKEYWLNGGGSPVVE